MGTKVKSMEDEIVTLRAEQKQPLTPHFELCNTNIEKQLLLYEEIRGKTQHIAHVEDLPLQGTLKTKVYMAFTRLNQ